MCLSDFGHHKYKALPWLEELRTIIRVCGEHVICVKGTWLWTTHVKRFARLSSLPVLMLRDCVSRPDDIHEVNFLRDFESRPDKSKCPSTCLQCTYNYRYILSSALYTRIWTTISYCRSAILFYTNNQRQYNNSTFTKQMLWLRSNCKSQAHGIRPVDRAHSCVPSFHGEASKKVSP